MIQKSADKDEFKRLEKPDPCSNEIVVVTGSSIRYQRDCGKNEVKLWIEGYEDRKISLYFCKGKNHFYSSWDSFYSGCVLGHEKNELLYKSLTEIPAPKFFNNFSEDSEIPKDAENRFLFLDASSSPFLNFSAVLSKKEDSIFEEAKALDIHGNLVIMLKNFNSSNIREFIVKLNEQNYRYENDFKLNSKEIPTDTLKSEWYQKNKVFDSYDENLAYLKANYEHLEKIKSLTLNELKQLNQYRETLVETLQRNKLTLSNTAKFYYRAILQWSPTWINLTPLPLSVPDTDEITIEISASDNSGNPVLNPTVVGKYRTVGGWVFDLGGKFYVTGLKNNEAYVESINNDGVDRRFARLKGGDELSIGYGINAEMALRTGWAIRPTINLGTFIPFEEEINPYFALGPGLNVQGKQVKFSFSAGLALGSVNVLNDQYAEKDLSGADLVNVQLTEKAWKTSWFLGVGLRYNLKKENKE
jgi:hypothetical protein